MADQDVLFCLVFDRLNRVNHTHILALLERGFCLVDFNVLKALFANNFVELKRELGCFSSDLHTSFVPVGS